MVPDQCHNQSTCPVRKLMAAVVAAVSSVAKIRQAGIVACVVSESAGAGARADIDESAETAAKAIETVGGGMGRAIIFNVEGVRR